MHFSLVVTCYNEMNGIERWYEDLKAQTRQPDEIVVVDSESKDGTTEFLKGWQDRDSRVNVIVKKCTPARGHNIGNEAAKYEHIVSTDMGVRLDPKWFEEIVCPFEEDPSTNIVAGSYEIDATSVASPAARAENYIEGDICPFMREPDGSIVPKPGIIPSNRSQAYRKKIWHDLEDCPEDLTHYADDTVFGKQMIQAGYKISPAPAALVYWQRPFKLRAFWKEASNYGKGRGEAALTPPVTFRMYKRGTLPRSLVPLLTGLRWLLRLSFPRAFFKAVKRFDLPAALYVPVLLFGNGYVYGKAYLSGYEHGEKHCLHCRSRLREAKQFSEWVSALK